VGFDLHTVLKVSKTNGAYRATLDFIEAQQKDYPVSSLACKNGSVRLQLNTLGSYEGTIDPAGTEIHGSFSAWDGRTCGFSWKRTARPDDCPPPLAASDYAPAGNVSLQGFWEGAASVRGIPVHLNLKISGPVAGTYRAEMDSLDIGFAHLPVGVTCDKPTVELSLFGMKVEGTLNSSNTEISGTIPAGTLEIPWTLKRGNPEARGDFSFAAETDLPGHWQGVLGVQGLKLRLFLDIARLPDGRFSATLHSPDQGLTNTLATAIRYRPPEARIEWIWRGSSFAGRLERGRLSGVWSGDGVTAPLVFQRSDSK
jgi:hypothetical protein